MGLATARLGAGGPEITRLGLGTWAIGGPGWLGSWGPQDDDESVRAILAAVERGVSWIDTAAVYGLGHSEEIVARALSQLAEADRPLVFTKCGRVWTDESPRPRSLLSPESIRRECEASLRRLGVERIDLYQCHWPGEDVPVEESWSAMAELVEEGKARWIGVSNFDLDLLERCERIRHVDSLQPPFSLIQRHPARDLLPWCAAHGTGVIVYSPLASGLLTGAWTRERVEALAPDDWRRRSSQFTEPRLSRNLELVELLRLVAARHGASVAGVALAWVLRQPAVTAAIVGARRPEQVDGWIGAATLELSDGDLAEIARAVRRSGADADPPTTKAP